MSDLSNRAQSTSPVTVETVAGISSWLLLRVWLTLGVQSFGGGTATLFLMRQAVVERYRWLAAEDFTRSWGVSQIAPGINLLGLTILIGWRLARSRGVVLALFGLLAPSVTITVLMTALYRQIQGISVRVVTICHWHPGGKRVCWWNALAALVLAPSGVPATPYRSPVP